MKNYVLIALLVVSFLAGYKASNWHQSALELVAEKAATKAGGQFQNDQKEIATNVVNSLDQWKQNNQSFNERVTHEKIIQPVFLNKCVSDDYRIMFNEATANFAAKASGSSKPTTKTGN
ncbi:putative spanin [Erwinia phage FIfi106]|nr:putative spanin [Erwinia phage FIfi106]